MPVNTAGVELESGEVLAADVILDCSGRYSRMPRWLEAAGWEAPAVRRVESHVTYASRHLKLPPGYDKAGFCQRLRSAHWAWHPLPVHLPRDSIG